MLLGISAGAYAQSWVAGGLPAPTWADQTRAIAVDEANSRLYVAGKIGADIAISGQYHTICVYDGSVWDTLGLFYQGLIYDMEMYGGELYVAGTWDSLNGQEILHLAKYDGFSWSQAGGSIDNGVLGLDASDGKLFITGGFSEVGSSIPALYAAMYDGLNWSALPNFPTFSSGGPSTIITYQGDIYAGGFFTTQADTIHDLIRYSSGTGSWERVGTTDHIQGTFAGVWSMMEYNGELFVGGSLYKGEGNVGHGIQKWDGTTWTDVGAGMQDWQNSYNGNATVMHLDTAYGYLWASGIFSYAGFMKTDRLACWNGTQWCGVGATDFDGGNIEDFAFFNDTLYVTTGDTADGNFVDNFAKWMGGYVYQDSCSSPVGVVDYVGLELTIYPNPTTDELNISLPNTTGECRVSIFNGMGQLVTYKTLHTAETQLSLAGNPAGIYVVRVVYDGRIVTKKLIKQI